MIITRKVDDEKIKEITIELNPAELMAAYCEQDDIFINEKCRERIAKTYFSEISKGTISLDELVYKSASIYKSYRAMAQDVKGDIACAVMNAYREIESDTVLNAKKSHGITQ